MTIEPGETYRFICKLEVRGHGPFEAPMWMALEDNGIRTITLTVRGIAVPTEKGREAP